MQFKEILEKRYATKKFNGESIPEEKVEQLKDMIQLAASSFGLQPWKIKVITDKETKQKLQALSWNQEQVTTCSHLLIFCANTDVASHIDQLESMLKSKGMPEENIKTYVGMMRNFESGMDDHTKLCWAQKQAYIALSIAMNGAKELGFDACPMEGFDPKGYAKELNLPEHLVPSVVLPIGFAADEPKPKMRFPKEELFF